MRLKTIICALVIFASFANTSVHAAPAGASDYYKIGEMMWAVGRFNYLYGVAGSIKEQFKGHRALLEKTGMGAQTLASFDEFTSVITSIDITIPSDKWSQDANQKWDRAMGKDGLYSKFLNTLDADIKNKPQPYFLVWLGFDTMSVAWSLPQWLQNGGVDKNLDFIKSKVNEFAWYPKQQVFNQVAPEIQTAIKTIANLKAKLDNPLSDESLTRADVENMIAAAQQIRQAARSGKLSGLDINP
jgi:hypothetical protein